LSKIEGRLPRMDGVETSKIDEEKLSGSGDYSSDTLYILSVMVINKEETSLSVSKDYTRFEKIVIS
jgi:hypothetical protein